MLVLITGTFDPTNGLHLAAGVSFPEIHKMAIMLKIDRVTVSNRLINDFKNFKDANNYRVNNTRTSVGGFNPREIVAWHGFRCTEATRELRCPYTGPRFPPSDPR